MPDVSISSRSDEAPRTERPSENFVRLLVITGSTRPGRFGPVVARWFAQHAATNRRLAVDTVDLGEVEIPSTAFAASVRASEAAVLVTPEYNHSFPGPLKAAIDSLREEWHALPVGFVSYGGISGGLRAVEALRIVFAELHAITVRETVSIAQAWDRFDEHGNPRGQEELNAAADRMIRQLTWWAYTIRTSRELCSYVG